MKKDTWTTFWGTLAAAGQAAQVAPLGKYAWIAQLLTVFGLAGLGKQAAGVERK